MPKLSLLPAKWDFGPTPRKSCCKAVPQLLSALWSSLRRSTALTVSEQIIPRVTEETQGWLELNWVSPSESGGYE